MLENIRMQNFRSYRDDSFEFGDSVNIIVGPNASGKTNLIEAVLVAARGNSFRANDAALINFNNQWARIDGRFDTGVRVVKIERRGESSKKTFEVDGKPLQRPGVQKTVPVLLFEPNHLMMVAGPPELRRNFLDDIVEEVVPGFATTRRAYRRVLSQRNALLKKGITHAQHQIFVWNLRLSELGGKIAAERIKVIEKFNENAAETYRSITGSNSSVEIKYKSACPLDQYESALLRRLETGLERDCLLGFTGAGPHRDDIEIVLNGSLAETGASRGETRSIVLTLKNLELAMLEEFHGTAPLVLLDDVFSELDGKRRHAVTTHLKKYQTFITTTDADIVGKNFTKTSNVIALA